MPFVLAELLGRLQLLTGPRAPILPIFYLPAFMLSGKAYTCVMV